MGRREDPLVHPLPAVLDHDDGLLGAPDAARPGGDGLAPRDPLRLRLPCTSQVPRLPGVAHRTLALRQMEPEQREGCILLFSAHGTPMSFVRAGDPYVERIQATVDGVMELLRPRLDAPLEHRLVFQSRVGPVKWTSPYLDKTLEELPREGRHSVLILPVAFVSDHLETLHELDIEAKEDAEKAGIKWFARTASLNADPDFLAALTQVAAEALG
jgi:ferrochelatase